MKKDIKVGVLAVQGSFAEHITSLKKITNTEAIEIRNAAELTEDIQALIIPGGESTTMGHFLKKNNFLTQIKSWFTPDKVIWGTCAGLILLAETIENEKEGGQCKIGGLAITASRNSFGRQKESAEENLQVTLTSSETEEVFHGVFIRAPRIIKVHDDKVKILAKRGTSGEIVGVRQGNILATTFHPELTDDLRFHQYFVQMIKNK